MNEQEQTQGKRMLIPNSFQTPNIIVDDLLPYLKSTEIKVIIFLIRKTFGWGKKEDRISLSQFEKGTGAGRANIVEALKQLRECNLVVRTESTKGDIYKLNLNWDYDENIKWFQNRTSSETKPVSKRNQSGFKTKPESGFETKHTETHSFKPTLLNIYIEKNVCPNCHSKVRIKNKRSGKYKEVLFCETCKCEFIPLTETEGQILVKGTDFEAIECYNKYYELHPNSDSVIYDKATALKMFQNILNRCRNNGKNGKEIILERMVNYFENDFYDKVNWSIETFSKNFNSFATASDPYDNFYTS